MIETPNFQFLGKLVKPSDKNRANLTPKINRYLQHSLRKCRNQSDFWR